MELVLAYDRLDEVIQLFKEYTGMIMSQSDEVREVLKSQHFEDELADINKKYGLPSGRLYIAADYDRSAGCAGLIRNDDSYCEIKRLYVRLSKPWQRIHRRSAQGLGRSKNANTGDVACQATISHLK